MVWSPRPLLAAQGIAGALDLMVLGAHGLPVVPVPHLAALGQRHDVVDNSGRPVASVDLAAGEHSVALSANQLARDNAAGAFAFGHRVDPPLARFQRRARVADLDRLAPGRMHVGAAISRAVEQVDVLAARCAGQLRNRARDRVDELGQDPVGLVVSELQRGGRASRVGRACQFMLRILGASAVDGRHCLFSVGENPR